MLGLVTEVRADRNHAPPIQLQKAVVVREDGEEDEAVPDLVRVSKYVELAGAPALGNLNCVHSGAGEVEEAHNQQVLEDEQQAEVQVENVRQRENTGAAKSDEKIEPKHAVLEVPEPRHDSDNRSSNGHNSVCHVVEQHPTGMTVQTVEDYSDG